MPTADNSILFQTITAPMNTLLNEPEIGGISDSARKLTFPRFVRLMLYLCLKGLDSLRSLHSEMQNNPQNIKRANLIECGVSTISDAFLRYPITLVQRLYQMLLAKASLPEVEEFRELGRLTICDSSLFPMSIRAFWAVYQKYAHGLKMHLCFSLNAMLPVCFLTTNGKRDDRKGMRELIEAGVTYIADRGYIAFDLFFEIVKLTAFFIIRSRKNLRYQVQQTLTVNLPEAVRYIFLAVTDEWVIFDGDRHRQVYRRISFRTRQKFFILITNRLDLTTYDIIKLYCFRWQVELFFRYLKQTLQAKQLLNLSEAGVAIHFYLVLIAHLLLVIFKYQQQQLFMFQQEEYQQAREEQGKRQTTEGIVFHNTENFVATMGKTIPRCFKITKHERQAIRDALLQRTVQLKFAFI
jgi:hypothetical protein